ncbi:MAG: hypothetical protein HKN68_04825 [Saprospiraceae bacterium]|nr:hypothetical protein [Saprospiraceae bacterium]
MKIYYSDQHPVPDEIKEMLEMNALSKTMISDSTINDIYLEEGRLRIIGADAIKEHLITLIREVKQGWYCQC